MALPGVYHPRITGEKRCAGCKVSKALSAFNPLAALGDKLPPLCLECRKGIVNPIVPELLDALADGSPIATGLLQLLHLLSPELGRVYTSYLQSLIHVPLCDLRRASGRTVAELAERGKYSPRYVWQMCQDAEAIFSALLTGTSQDEIACRYRRRYRRWGRTSTRRVPCIPPAKRLPLDPVVRVARQRERIRQWRTARPGITAIYQRHRRAHQKGIGGSHTQEQWLAVCAFYGNRCLGCGSTGPLTADHVISVKRGGTNDVGNLQPLCQPCNSHKSARNWDYRPHFI